LIIVTDKMKEEIIIRSIPNSEAEPWLLFRHYARRLCPISYAFGAFINNDMIGVVTYGTPLSSTLRDGICGEEHSNLVLELNRLCCESRKNLASKLVGQSLAMLPSPSIVVSYADTGKGHVGYVYQATNFIYTGLSSAFKDPMVRGMEHKHHTTIGDEGRGHPSRVEYLRGKYGEDNVYYIERDRKHRYVFFQGSKTQRKKLTKLLRYKILPYPKGESQRYNANAKIIIQTSFF
jgi:hypothetical protein